VPAFDLTLGLGMVGSATDMLWAVLHSRWCRNAASGFATLKISRKPIAEI
jgi:hypothetical protein